MKNDQFEVGLSKLYEEQQSEQQNQDKKAVAPVWQKAWIVRQPELKLAIRNPKGSAEPCKEIGVSFLSGLGLQGVLEQGIVQLAVTKKPTSTH
ncbi:MAG: hypothetical protein AAGC86_11795 [Pseudomonadota bacterium]